MKTNFFDMFSSLKRVLTFRCAKKHLSRYISNNIMSELISVDTMLCQSASIAENKFKDNPEKLMDIIKTHHVGMETLLGKMGVEINRSTQGIEFDSEIMSALPQVVNTDNPEMHGMVAASVSPRFVMKNSDGEPERLLQRESVILFCYKKR